MNGDCIDLLGGHECHCYFGFYGDNCEENIDDCIDHACENNATCVDGAANYTCQCQYGYKGELCEIAMGLYHSGEIEQVMINMSVNKIKHILTRDLFQLMGHGETGVSGRPVQ